MQYFRADYYKQQSLRIQQKYIIDTPQRGSVFDCRGRVLAASEQIKTIFAEPKVISKPDKVAAKLAPILNKDEDVIFAKITESGNPGFARLYKEASQEQCTFAKEVHFGIGVLSEWKRRYPTGSLTSHVVGFASGDGRGLDGVELKHNKQLVGKSASNIYLADKGRRTIRPKEAGHIARDGNSIILTIDAAIQQFARQELEKRFLEYEAEAATAIVAQPKTGAILAMVSLPDFEPNDRSCDPNFLRNRAITDQFEPGSMLKPIVAAIAIDKGVVTRREKIFCENGSYRGKGFGRIGEYGDHKFGNLSVRDIIVKSSNIGMAKIGQRFERQDLYEGLRFFGFGKTTGIDLPGEVSGLLRTTDKWTGYSDTRIPYGQEITVTAMQMIKAFCILSNGGKVVTPYVVKAIVDNEGEIIKLQRGTPPVGHVINPEVANWAVQDAMVGVVNERKQGGTGWRAKLDKWQVYGKTGTANIALEDAKGYSEDNYVASFIAGAPAENPAIVVLVSIRKPNKKLGKGYTGGAVSSPVVGKIIEKTLTYLERHNLL